MTSTASPHDFLVTNYIQQGGAGKVYAAKWKSCADRAVALKFFGYTQREPKEADIAAEIELLQSLKGVMGIVQLEAVFMDPPRGIVPGKQYRRSYPCIVMELLEGGELFDKLDNTDAISEKDIAHIFRGIVLALKSCHDMGFIHRDLKLENVMLTSKLPGSAVKLIDFGMMVRLQPDQAYHKSSSVHGTPGFVAPESLIHKVYSPASDIWQAGVCLYCMLSGLAPFHPKHPQQIVNGTYFPMAGVGWEGISEAAKDLVARILVKDPAQRATSEQILNHPWVTTVAAPDMNLGSDYLLRIKHLGLRQKMKTFFIENNITEGNKFRRDSLKMVLPVLEKQQRRYERNKRRHEARENATRSALPRIPHDTPTSPGLYYRKADMSSGSGNSSNDMLLAFRNKLKVLKTVVMGSMAKKSAALFSSSESGGPDSMSVTEDMDVDAASDAYEIDYATFEMVIHQCGLHELATPQVFSIFDSRGKGTINPKDFLLTMLAFRPEEEVAAVPQEGEEAARLYFNIFDIEEKGYITKEELKIVMGCLLQDEFYVPLIAQMDKSGHNIDEVFSAMDMSSDGKIDFEEFKMFYNTVLHYSITRASMSIDDFTVEHRDPTVP